MKIPKMKLGKSNQNLERTMVKDEKGRLAFVFEYNIEEILLLLKEEAHQ